MFKFNLLRPRGGFLPILLSLLTFFAFLGAFESPAEAASSPSHSAHFARSLEPHTLDVITSGAHALKLKLDLIASARESVELETFSYTMDEVGRLILNALMDKARAGVRVRLLVDFYGSKKHKFFTGELRAALKNAGVDVRFYNTQRFKLFPVNHRKFLIVDRRVVLSGGRNISKENFNVDPERNRLDYTMILRGPIVPSVLRSFNEYWNSSMVSSLPVRADLGFQFNAADRELLRQLNAMRFPQPISFQVSNVTFVSDEPTNRERLFLNELLRRMNGVRRSFLAESPDFNMGDRMTQAFLQLIAKTGVMIDIVTNSDSAKKFGRSVPYVVAGGWTTEEDLRANNVHVWAKGTQFSAESEPLLNADLKNTPWRTHCKMAIFDNSTVLISSYNFDIVSEEKNSEAGFYFDGAKDLAQFFRLNMRSRTFSK